MNPIIKAGLKRQRKAAAIAEAFRKDPALGEQVAALLEDQARVPAGSTEPSSKGSRRYSFYPEK